jgi:predicted ATPase
MNDRSAPLVASICNQLDGCPLAITIAAARMDAFDLPMLAQLISGPFSLQMLGERLRRHGIAPSAPALSGALKFCPTKS